MSKSPRDSSLTLPVDEAIFGRTLVGWSLNESRVVVQFRQNQIVFVMPGGRRVRIDFLERLKPISDFVINSEDKPHFIAIRPNAEVVGLKSFNSRIVDDGSEHDTRYITLFIDKDIDDFVDRIAAMNEKYRLVMRHITPDVIPRYDPFHVRAAAYNRKRKRSDRDFKSPNKPKTKGRRRHSCSSSGSSSNWSDVVDPDHKPQKRRKSEPLKKTMRSSSKLRKARSLSPAALHRSRSRSPENRGKHDHSPLDSEHKSTRRHRRSRSASLDSRDRRRNRRSSRRSRGSRRARKSTLEPSRHEKHSEKERSKNDRSESESDDERDRRRSRRTEPEPSKSETQKSQRRRRRDRRRSPDAMEESDLDSRSLAKSTRKRSRRRSRAAESRSPESRRKSPARKRRERSKTRTREESGETTDSESHLRPAQEKSSRKRSPSRETKSDLSPAHTNRKLFSPDRSKAKRSSGNDPAATEQRRRTAYRTVSSQESSEDYSSSDELSSSNSERRSGDDSCESSDRESQSQRLSADMRDIGLESNNGTVPKPVNAGTSDCNGNANQDVGSLSKSLRSKSIRDAAVVDDHADAEKSASDDESVQSRSDKDPSEFRSRGSLQPDLCKQRTARKSSTPARAENLTPSSDEDSESGASKSIANPLQRSTEEPPADLDMNDSVDSSSSLILRPGMTIYWFAPGRILPQRKRQSGKIVEVFSHRKRIGSQMCLRLDTGDVLTVNEMVKVDPRSNSAPRRLSDFTLITD